MVIPGGQPLPEEKGKTATVEVPFFGRPWQPKSEAAVPTFVVDGVAYYLDAKGRVHGVNPNDPNDEGTFGLMIQGFGSDGTEVVAQILSRLPNEGSIQGKD